MKTLKDFSVKDKLVLLRVDINSPVVNKKILDNPRLKEASETIKYLIEKNAKLIIIAHQGRKGSDDFIGLNQHAEILSKYVGKRINYVDGLFEDNALEAIDNLESGEAVLLKNVRAYEDEMALDESRFYSFSGFFDLYVNEAFSVSHRSQGSIVIPPSQIPSCIGLNFEREIKALENFNIENNEPAVYIIGGAKIDDYLPIFNVLKNKNAKILTSGVLADLLLVLQGKDLGYENNWLKEKGYLELSSKLKKIYSQYKDQIILPVDFAIDGKIRKEISLGEFPVDKKIWDVGHKTLEIYKREMEKAKIIFMKGPLGYSEIDKFSYGTVETLRIVSELTEKKKCFSLLGGGHLTTSIQEYKIPNNFSHISTSGGALIAQISGEKLPGLEALKKGIKK